MSYRVYLDSDRTNFVTVDADRVEMSHDHKKLDLFKSDDKVASFTYFIAYVQNDNLI